MKGLLIISFTCSQYCMELNCEISFSLIKKNCIVYCGNSKYVYDFHFHGFFHHFQCLFRFLQDIEILILDSLKCIKMLNEMECRINIRMYVSCMTINIDWIQNKKACLAVNCFIFIKFKDKHFVYQNNFQYVHFEQNSESMK